jgi:hypothetical protein
MKPIIQLVTARAEKRGLALILTRDKARQSKVDLIAAFVLKGPLFVVSGDEWMPSFLLPSIIRERTTDVKEILARLGVARVSTCYRLYDSLAHIPSQGEPILVMDFLHTFYDDDIPLRTRLFRLRECCRELKRLAFYRSVIVMVQEEEVDDYEKFIPALRPIADMTIFFEPESERSKQPTLF